MQKILVGGKRKASDSRSNGSADTNRVKSRKCDGNWWFGASHVFMLLEKNKSGVLFDIKCSLIVQSLSNDVLQHVLQIKLTYFGPSKSKKKWNEAT